MVEFIGRETAFSPGDNIEKDAAILEAVRREVARSSEVPGQVVFHMSRRMSTLMQLEQREREGVRVINPPSAVRMVSKSREMTMQRLQDAGVKVPPFWAYDPEYDVMFQCEPDLQQLLPGWVKCSRANGHDSGDVQRVSTPLEADSAVMLMAAQAIPDIIVQQHVDGELLKSYAVVDVRKCVVDCWPSDMKDLALMVSQATGLEVFGFDVILSADGPVVIDVNDWPSFSPVRVEAACAIAKLIQE